MIPVASGEGGGVSDGALEALEIRQETAGGLSTDAVYQTLSNHRRRSVLRALLASEQLTVRELTAYVAARECDVPVPALEYKQRKRVYTSLVQTHLPAMAKNGVVDYDKSRGTVGRTSATLSFARYLDGAAAEPAALADSSGWSRRYLGLAAVFAAVLAVAWLGVGPAVADLAYATGFTAALAVVAAVHWWTERATAEPVGSTVAESRDWSFRRRDS